MTSKTSADLAITTMLDTLLTELLPPGGMDSAQSRLELESRRARVQRLQEAGFPRRALDTARITASSRLPELLALHRWDSWRHNFAILSGAVGCGKTVAATWWALNRFGGDVAFVRASTFAATGIEDDNVLGREALVLDDLGVEHEDDAAEFEELIDTYYGNRRPMVITTELTQNQIRDRYGDRIASRLREAAVWVNFLGPSLRA